jgi:Sulfatase-modifying factor enzyme 1
VPNPLRLLRHPIRIHLPRAIGWGVAGCLLVAGAAVLASDARALQETKRYSPRLDVRRPDFVFALPRLAPGDIPQPSGACPADMVLVEGDYCPAVVQSCLKPMAGATDRCRKYAESTRCVVPTQPRRVCIDRYEYPNLYGVKPTVMVSWDEAKAACETEGKRLCTNREWTLACEGEHHLPYPYGFRRDATACNIDRPWREVDFGALFDPKRTSEQIARLDQRVASGSLDRCESPYGVFDMTGNVDEWVVNEPSFLARHPSAYVSGLKGGYWGPVRDRCRPTTIAHPPSFRFYQIGFRCCADPADGG